MIIDVTDSEYLLAQKTAEEYRSQGYEVEQGAPLEFLPGFRADLLVRKNDEMKVVVVRARRSLAADPKVAEVARLLESKPGWSFELLLVSEPERVDSPERINSFNGERIAGRLAEAEQSLQVGLPEAAFLLAWSALEAVTRALVEIHGGENAHITSPRFLLDQATFHGLISRNEYNEFNRMLKYRNAIVHGFDTDDFDDELVIALIDAVRRKAAALKSS